MLTHQMYSTRIIINFARYFYNTKYLVLRTRSGTTIQLFALYCTDYSSCRLVHRVPTSTILLLHCSLVYRVPTSTILLLHCLSLSSPCTDLYNPPPSLFVSSPCTDLYNPPPSLFGPFTLYFSFFFQFYIFLFSASL